MAGTNVIEDLLKRDRVLVIAALATIIALSWLYVLAVAGIGMSAFDMSSLPMALGSSAEKEMTTPMSEGMGGTMAAMATPADWTFGYALLMFFMWWVMMIAMMLPSATPMILLHARVHRKAQVKAGAGGRGLGPTAAFTLGYLLAWGVFSALAAGLQWAFEGLGLLSAMTMNTTSALFAGFILLFAGTYQLTPIKQACLRHCRGPIQFLSRHWKPGSWGAFRMGLHHGAFCLGCCWGLMVILFFGGIMNLYWIAGLAVVVLLEKVIPVGPKLGMLTGGLLILWSAGFFYRAFF
jgi:predicted metal-binding membrane protein